MSGLAKLTQRLAAAESWFSDIYGYAERERDFLRAGAGDGISALNSIRHSIGGRDSVIPEAIITLAAQAEEIERLRTDVLRVVDGAHPYRDESGIIEIPLHTFGLLWRIADEARAALQPAPDGMGEA